VATETAGAKEIIQDGVTGLLVPIADVDRLTESIVALLKDRQRRIQIGIAAREAVSAQFSIERMIEETEEIYRAVIEEK
jgi:glycosyltransferase involved in cell wall biosynthesis